MPEEKAGLDDNQTRELTNTHLEGWEPECRWCFAVDMYRVKGKIITQYDFPDATLFHLSCPRCGGEFSYYSEGWEGDYLRNIISKLHPELGGSLEDKLFKEILHRVFPEYSDV